MNYVQVPELEANKCTGCAHDEQTINYTAACVTQRGGVAAWESCNSGIWIADTDEARIMYLTIRITA